MTLFLTVFLAFAFICTLACWLFIHIRQNFVDQEENSYYDSMEDTAVLDAPLSEADINARYLMKEYSQIEKSNLSDKEKLEKVLAWMQKLQQYELTYRKHLSDFQPKSANLFKEAGFGAMSSFPTSVREFS